MSSNYNGQPSNVVITNGGGTIVSSTNDPSAIVVTTSTPHGYSTGDWIEIAGHATNYSANGVWPIIVLTPTTFSIPVAGVGVGGMTGEAVPLNLGATYTIPSDGDADAAASVNVALETLGDRTAFVGLYGGAYSLIAQYDLLLDDAGYSVNTNASPAGTGTANYTIIGTTQIEIGTLAPGCLSTDIFLAEFTGTATTSAAGGAGLALFWAEKYPGGSYTTPAGIKGSDVAFTHLVYAPVHLKGLMNADGAGSNTAGRGVLKVMLYGQIFTAAQTVGIIGSYTMTLKQYRSKNAFV